MISSRKLRRAWQLLPPADREELESLGDLSPLIAQLLRNRGVTSREEAHVFLHPQPMAQHNPLRLPNAEAAVERIASAIEGQETIAIFGDFDADGVTSAALLMEGMRALGARLVPYIPDRVAEGHGLNLPELQAELTRHYLERALDEAGGNMTHAAQLVGLPSYQTFTNWLNRYNVRRSKEEPEP